MAPMVPYPGRMATQMHAQNTGLMPRPGMPGGQVPFTHMPQGPGAMGMPMGAAQAAHMQNPMMAHQPLTPQMAQVSRLVSSMLGAAAHFASSTARPCSPCTGCP